MSFTQEKRFAGQTVALIGSATGLGRAMAMIFAREGARLALADVDEEGVGLVGDAARNVGAEVITRKVDVSKAADVEQFAQEARTAFGPVHVVCSNAGVNECPGPAWALEATDWQWVMSVNLFGLVNVTKAFLPMMFEQGFGHIVSTASSTSLVSNGGVAAYVASKKANLGYCEALQHDLTAIKSPVKVAIICPGKIMSEMPNSARSRPAELAGRVPNADELAAMRAFLADGGLTPEDVAAAAVDGIAAGRFYILTHPGMAEETLSWAQDVVAGQLAHSAPPI